MPRCAYGSYLVTTSSLFRSLHALSPRRMFRWSAPLHLVGQVAQRHRRTALPQRLVDIHAHATSQPLVRCPPRPAGRKCRRWVRREYPHHASHSRKRRKADMWRRSIDIRRALPGNVRAGPESRPEHSPLRCGRPSVRRSEYDTHKPGSGRRRRLHALQMGKTRCRAGNAAYSLIKKIYA